MKSLAEMMSEFKPDPKAPKHELAASVNEIIQVVGKHKKYGYGYWLGLVRRSGKSYTEILGLLKELKAMDAKYPKGAVLTNKLIGKRNEKNISRRV